LTPRTYRIAALSLPLLVLVVLASTGGWRIHDSRVERISHPTVRVAQAPGAAQVRLPVDPRGSAVSSGDRSAFVHHLSPSVPWPAWAGLLSLCLLPAAASILVRSDGRRRRDAAYSGVRRAS
jgi:hypothetical protein